MGYWLYHIIIIVITTTTIAVLPLEAFRRLCATVCTGGGIFNGKSVLLLDLQEVAIVLYKSELFKCSCDFVVLIQLRHL